MSDKITKFPPIDVSAESDLDEIRGILAETREDAISDLREEASEVKRRYEAKKKVWDEMVEGEYAKIRMRVLKLRIGNIQKLRASLRESAARLRAISEEWPEIDVPRCMVCTKAFPGLEGVEDEDVFMTLPCDGDGRHKYCHRCFLKMLAIKNQQPAQTLTVRCPQCRTVVEYDVRSINLPRRNRRTRGVQSIVAVSASPFTPNQVR